MALQCLLNFIIKKVSIINIILDLLSLEIIDKKLGKKKFYLIGLTNFDSKTLIILGIKIMVKLDSITS